MSRFSELSENSARRASDGIEMGKPVAATAKLIDLFAPVRDELGRVEAAVRRAAAVEYPLLRTVLAELVSAGGKRLRPAIMLLIARAFDADMTPLIPASAAAELIHTAGLVHDDIIDNATERRGTPTLNSVFTSGTVILVGDYLFAQAARVAAETGNARVMAIFGQILTEITDGQLREIFKAHDPEQSRDDYERRIYGKTASLFAGAAEIAGVLCGASSEQLAGLRDYGRYLGLAFQVVDDVLDLRESSDGLGKPAGSDLRQGTVTLPMMLYLAGDHDAAGVARLRAAIRGHHCADGEYDAVVGMLRASGVLHDSMGYAARYTERAKESLARLPGGHARDALLDIADFAVARDR